jgi:thymidylate synthase (FAD)
MAIRLVNKIVNIEKHGFVKIVDCMPRVIPKECKALKCDYAIVQAARVSFNQGIKSTEKDIKLIDFLMKNKHTSPFEMVKFKFHIKCPIFIARQWLRHRTSSVNEYSARYSIVDNQYYLPDADKISIQSASNKQGRGEIVDDERAKIVQDTIKTIAENSYNEYNEMLEDGIAREIARVCLPLNFYTEFYWKINLHNLMHFLKLRADSHAQYEIRVYALKMMEIMKLWVPYTYDAFVDYKSQSMNFSAKMIAIIKRRMKGEEITYENSGLGKREWEEIKDFLYEQ